MKTIIASVVFLQCITCMFSQRVAPGVPPQQYRDMPPQHQPPPPQYQQQQYQQAQYQQQQAPVHPQQGYQQQPPPPPPQQHPQAYQQQPPQGHHGGHHGNPQVLNTQNLAHEKEHIAEHMDVPIDTSKMSEAELQFHYFKMHDSDNNNKLDGCELIKSLIHWHEQGSKHQEANPNPQQPMVEEKIFSDDELTNLIDPILNMDDHNKDGFIDYPEFIRAQQKSQAHAAQQQAQGQH